MFADEQHRLASLNIAPPPMVAPCRSAARGVAEKVPKPPAHAPRGRPCAVLLTKRIALFCRPHRCNGRRTPFTILQTRAAVHPCHWLRHPRGRRNVAQCAPHARQRQRRAPASLCVVHLRSTTVNTCNTSIRTVGRRRASPNIAAERLRRIGRRHAALLRRRPESLTVAQPKPARDAQTHLTTLITSQRRSASPNLSPGPAPSRMSNIAQASPVVLTSPNMLRTSL